MNFHLWVFIFFSGVQMLGRVKSGALMVKTQVHILHRALGQPALYSSGQNVLEFESLLLCTLTDVFQRVLKITPFHDQDQLHEGSPGIASPTYSDGQIPRFTHLCLSSVGWLGPSS